MVKGGDKMSEIDKLIEMLRKEIRRAILIYVLFWLSIVAGVVFLHYCVIEKVCLAFLR
jgi:hypothetical protein